jgi:hypothetical protein
MAHCFQVERVLDAVAEPVAVRDCISGEECYGAVQILEERSNPFKSNAVENLTSLLLQWQISGEYTSDGFDNEVGTKLKELLELYNVTAWQAAIAKQCKRAADWCLVSPEWNTALNQAKRIKWCINRLHTVWSAPIRSSECAQLASTAHMLNMLAADIMRIISIDTHGRSTRIPHAAHRQHNLLRDDTTATLAMSSLLNATTNQCTHLVRRVWRKIFYKAETSQQAAECFWAIRTTMQQAQSTHAGRLALSDRVQASVRTWWCILDQHPMWTIAAKAAAMRSTDLQDWLNDNLAELHQSTAICEYQGCLLPTQSPVQPSHQCNTKIVTGSCTLQHALTQWPLWNNGELTTELLEDVQRYEEFSLIVEQASTQLELNTDPEVCSFKTQEVCCKCTKQVMLHDEDNELSTDQCSDCWAESNLWRQLVVHVMHAKSNSWRKALRAHSGIAARNQPSNSHWLEDTWPTQRACLCCSNTYEPAQCSSYPLHSTVYCTSCWDQRTSKCRAIKQTIITLQRWWRGITHSVYHTTPTPTPGKERRQLQSLTSSSTSPTNYSPLTPQHYSQYSSMHLGLEASPIRAYQVDWSKPAHGRYQQARAQSIHRAQPEDQQEWAQRQLNRFPRRKLRRSDRAKQSPDRWHPSISAGSMDTSMSSSVGEAELQLALQDSGPAEVQARAAERHTATTFATLQPQKGRSVIPVDVLPEEMRLKPSSEVKVEASTRTKQSKIKFKQQIKLDRLKTLAITQTEAGHNRAIADSAPPEEVEMLATDSDEELQRAISYSLVHFSKHTIEMEATEQDNDNSTASEATTKHCTSCKGTKAASEFTPGLATCNTCRARKKQRRGKNAKPTQHEVGADRKLCSSKKWCLVTDFTGSNKTCDNCIKIARALTVARRQRQYAVPGYAANNTSVPDFL